MLSHVRPSSFSAHLRLGEEAMTPSNVRRIEENSQQLLFLDIQAPSITMSSAGWNRLLSAIFSCTHLHTLSLEIQLDSTAKEELAKIYKRFSEFPSLRRLSLHLRYNPLADDSITGLFNGLQAQLNLKQSNIKVGTKQLADSSSQFGKCSSLEEIHIDLSQNQINPSEFSTILAIFINYSLDLKYLSLDFSNRNFSSNGHKNFKSDQEDNGISNQIRKQEKIPCSLVASTSKLESLKINAEKTQQTTESLCELFKIIGQLQSLSTLQLDISSQLILDEESIQQGRAMLLGIPNLKDLSLSFKHQQISSIQICNFIQPLASKAQLKHLTLNLENNLLIANETKNGIREIIGIIALIKSLQSLKIDFNHCQLGIIGAVDVIQGIQNFSNLKRLFLGLGHNGIGTIGLMDLIMCISKLNHIEHLSLALQGNMLDDKCMEDLGRTLANLKNLAEIHLYFQKNDLKHHGILHLLKGLNSNVKQTINQQQMQRYSQNQTKFFNSKCVESNQLKSLMIVAPVHTKIPEQLQITKELLKMQHLLSLALITKLEKFNKSQHCNQKYINLLQGSLKRLVHLDLQF